MLKHHSHIRAGNSPGPMATELRAEMLQSTDDTVAEVAVAVGYASEAALNRAFEREFDRPPAPFRRKRKPRPRVRSGFIMNGNNI